MKKIGKEDERKDSIEEIERAEKVPVLSLLQNLLRSPCPPAITGLALHQPSRLRPLLPTPALSSRTSAPWPLHACTLRPIPALHRALPCTLLFSLLCASLPALLPAPALHRICVNLQLCIGHHRQSCHACLHPSALSPLRA
ncbi:hypothetical protein SLEP1_g38248 [Rubroshorea leprosula]|uniref:Uncharacterized protein n=1 Tax=Rubroshorea leprosula TaxID=152421 RepID=A0AAV5KXK3_9ROSI|nr:hypothetical protein SLEP1_g38248 [Rubroshorea leprosula]